MTIVLTGGGSGGHITPILVVASELKRSDPGVKLVYIGQKGDRFADLPAKDSNIDEVYLVRAGKFRRYHGEGIKQLLDVSTAVKNIRDSVFTITGLYQSRRLIKKIKPDIVFSRGGYVSVPVCLAAKLNKVPYITHDADPVPSLTNRIISPWAKLHLVALPEEIYRYPTDKTVTTGIPVSRDFVLVNDHMRTEYKQKLNIDIKDKLLFVIGGGTGAQSLNDAILDILPHLLAEFGNLRVVHVVGQLNEASMKEKYTSFDADMLNRIEVLSFTEKVYLYSGAADVVVTRAGATNLAEFEIQGVACIVVPSTYLVAGHQLMNAKVLEESHAAIVIADTILEDDTNKLANEISLLLKDDKKRQQLGAAIAKFAHPNAAGEIAGIILKTAKGE